MRTKPVSLLCALGLLTATASSQTELVRLTVTDASTFAAYSDAVAMDGDVVLVGAPDDAVPANYTGSVYVFRENAGTWTQEAKLVAPDGQLHDRFGRRLDVEGDVAVIGAPANLSAGVGAVYIFRHDGIQWVFEQKLSQSTGWGNDWFGDSVALEGNRLVVGARWARRSDLVGSNNAGVAWVYEYDGVQWNITQMLGASDPYYGDLFGTQVAIEGDMILVSAIGEGDETLGQYYIGAVYAFEHDGTQWVETQKFRTLDQADQAQFGASLDLSGAVAVGGSPGKTGGRGSAYVFRRIGGAWVQEDKIDPPWGGDFGKTIAVEGNLLLVGTDGKDMEGESYGSVFPYRYDGTGWQPEPSFTGSGSKNNGLFADSLALDGNRAVAGGYESHGGALNDGAAYVFDVSPSFHVMIQPLPLESSDDGKFIVRHGVPATLTGFFYSVTGPGSLRFVLARRTDASGELKWEIPIPPAAQGLTLWMMAIQPHQLSNVLQTEIN